MKRTRRTLLATVAGSSALLAVDTLGQSQTTADRDVSVDVVSDADAYLSLVETDGTEDGVDAGGVLFESDEPRTAPATFDLKNQLPASTTVTLEAPEFSFELVDEPDRTLDDGSIELDSGTAVEVEVDIEEKSAGETPIEITADGSGARIEAKRSLTLVPESVTFEFAFCRGQSHNCADAVLEVSRTTDTVEAIMTIRPGESDEETHEKRISYGSERTFDLESIGPRKQTVRRTDPDPNETIPDGDSDKPVTLERDGITVKIHPATTVDEGYALVTVSVPDE